MIVRGEKQDSNLNIICDSLRKQNIGFISIGWVYIKIPFTFLWLGERHPGRAANGPLYLGKKT